MKVKRKGANVVREAAAKRQPRATETQIDTMVNYMVLHPNVATGKFDTIHGNQRLQGSWEELATLLNSHFEAGKSKDIESWKTTWRDNKTKVSLKFTALKNARQLTGNNPVNIKLTERDQKVIGLLGHDYMEGLNTVPDSFPEEHTNVNELLTDGDASILAIAPRTTSSRPSMLTAPQADLEMDRTSTVQQSNIEILHLMVVSEAIESENCTMLTDSLNIEDSESAAIDNECLQSGSDSNGSQRPNRQPELEPGLTSVAESLPGTSSNDITQKQNNRIQKRSVPPSCSQLVKRGKRNDRLGVQLQDARVEFAELAQRTCEATEIMARAEMKRAEAALIMANNDKSRVEILRTMAENDKARNVVLVNLVNTLDALIRK